MVNINVFYSLLTNVSIVSLSFAFEKELSYQHKWIQGL